MFNANFVLLYVDSPAASADFYTDIIGKPPVELSPTFAMFALGSTLMLGLWSKHTASPAPVTAGGGAELAMAVADVDAVNAMHDRWRSRGLQVIQAPVALDFGFTFVAVDPDGHRLRIFAPGV